MWARWMGCWKHFLRACCGLCVLKMLSSYILLHDVRVTLCLEAFNLARGFLCPVFKMVCSLLWCISKCFGGTFGLSLII